MCYVAETILTSHPTTKYNDGLTHLYLYCKGRPNTEVLLPLIKPPHNGKKLQEMLHYILTGEKPEDLNQDINDIDKVVTKIKKRGEVTTKYMKQWEREQAIAYEVAKETKVEDALEMIRFARDKNISDEETRTRIRRIGLDDTTIDELFIKISAEMPTLIGSENN
jgi:hypothetical protein